MNFPAGKFTDERRAAKARFYAVYVAVFGGWLRGLSRTLARTRPRRAVPWAPRTGPWGRFQSKCGFLVLKLFGSARPEGSIYSGQFWPRLTVFPDPNDRSVRPSQAWSRRAHSRVLKRPDVGLKIAPASQVGDELRTE